MKEFKEYKTAKAPQEAAERLPVGGYILTILNAEDLDYGLRISFDVAEGEHKGFYKSNFDAQNQEDKKWKGNYIAYVPKGDGTEQDLWTANSFKGMTEALEDSNPGYHWNWDEKKLKGLKVGGVFFNKEYEIDGRRGFYTACHHFTSTEVIRNKKYKIPKDKLLNTNTSGVQTLNEMEQESLDSLFATAPQ